MQQAPQNIEVCFERFDSTYKISHEISYCSGQRLHVIEKLLHDR